MEKVTIFYLEHCPYCRKAQQAVGELLTREPAFGKLAIDWVEESRQPELADQYDYYFVPSVFAGKEKLYECLPSEDYDSIHRHLREAFAQAMSI